MSNYYVNPYPLLKGTIALPPSKSQTLRAILLASLAEGDSQIDNILLSPDTSGCIQSCRAMGAEILEDGASVRIRGVGGKIDKTSSILDVGNSGICLRFLTAIAALCPLPVVITGDHSICTQRPMAPLMQALRELGCGAQSIKGDDCAPLVIQGPLGGGTVTVDGRDSQPISALLIAGSLSSQLLEIHVENPGEWPWIDLTLQWLERLGVQVEKASDYTRYRLAHSRAWSGFNYTVPGDLSSLSFPLVLALMNEADLLIQGVDMEDPQGDKQIVEILESMGAQFVLDKSRHTLSVQGPQALAGIAIDINRCIDTVCILAVLGCHAEGQTRITHAAVAREKECDRLACITAELRKMGANIEETEDGLRVSRSSLRGAEVDSFHDHRMAMSLAVAGFQAQGQTTVLDVDCVIKTFPDFERHLAQLGAKIEKR